MIVRLHNLAARAPRMTDLDTVTGLLIACDSMESYIAEPTAEDVCRVWESPDFCMETDAWVIVTNQGRLVGYADVRREGEEQIVSLIRVHPEYRGRGMGTLLIWLTEDRARQMLRLQEKEWRVVLSVTVSDMDQGARHLLEREGYSLTRHFWRLVIDVDEVSRTAQEEGSEEQRKLKLDLVIDAHSLLLPSSQNGARESSVRANEFASEKRESAHHTGIYVAHQYDVYEKVLRAGSKRIVEESQEKHYINA